jgi:hypothetical protein
LSLIGLGAVLAGYALHSAIWIAEIQPTQADTLPAMKYDYPTPGRAEFTFIHGGAWWALLAAMTISIFACFLHRHHVLTASLAIGAGLLAIGMTGLFRTAWSSRYARLI